MRASWLFACLWAFGASAQEALPTVGDVVYGARLFRLHCAQCHGGDKSGTGYLSRTLRNPPPKNLSDPGFLARRTNEDLFSIVTMGGRAVSAHFTMPNFGGQLEALDAWDLIAFLRKDILTLGTFFPRAGRYVTHEVELNAAAKERLGGQYRGDKLTVLMALSGSDASSRGPEYYAHKGDLQTALKGRKVLGYVTFAPVNIPGAGPMFVGMSMDPNGTIERIRPQLESTHKGRDSIERQLVMFEGQKAKVGADGQAQPLSIPLTAGKEGQALAKELTKLAAQALEAKRYFEGELGVR
jgi:mono/diheme cytochrome c family protein